MPERESKEVREYPPHFVEDLRRVGQNDMADLYNFVWARMPELTVEHEEALGRMLKNPTDAVLEPLLYAQQLEREGKKTESLALLGRFLNDHLVGRAELDPKIDPDQSDKNLYDKETPRE